MSDDVELRILKLEARLAALECAVGDIGADGAAPPLRTAVVGGPGVRVRDGEAVAVVEADPAGGGSVSLVDGTDTDPDTGEPVAPYGTLRVLLDWRYDTGSKKIQLLYGTLALVGGALTVEKDHDANGNDLWTDAHQAVEESY